ncbi:p53-like transcription factor, DNA-binding,p53 tumour suppressor family,p53, DNA-binding domain,p53/RUNT- [Cinara cedri]|uniref:p53-like transcription factor, DNA-binding,p53 tumour suppressor family,p53, DNA-binding domain,p53/RUNT n=1 Tax=Cinara cedri TaxID=506608 RepID=A0A5E4MLP1_9HEMI|nr:p53-like transcription factor, DNA-binding,p53 tumour suppressor family,p53, DNA-binding domain,p53/RUNT- [Cinara cedri]
MNTIKLKTELIESIDPDANTESLPSHSSEDSESYSISEHLTQTGKQINIDDYPGQLNFNFSLDFTEISKQHWMYSITLNKAYINMNRILPIQFYWQFDKADSLGIKNLRIRALLVFATPEFRQLSIKRCPIHIVLDRTSNPTQVEHIIWCEQSDAIYEQDPNSQRYSVVVPVHNSDPSSGSKSYDILYKFMCKSFCSTSFNRRPIYVIFTLETTKGQVLGRKKLGLKVCSVPKRDMLKEEAIEKKRLNGIQSLKKHSFEISQVTPMKKIKIENDNVVNDDNRTYHIPELTIPNKKLYFSTLELLHSHFLGSAVRDDNVINLHPLISTVGDLITQENSNDNAHSENQHS